MRDYWLMYEVGTSRGGRADGNRIVFVAVSGATKEPLNFCNNKGENSYYLVF